MMSHYEDDLPEAYEDLLPEEQATLQCWIRYAVMGSRTFSKKNSQMMKHDFQTEGFYVTNGQFKGAMLQAGYRPRERNAHNWEFAVQPRFQITDKTGKYWFAKDAYRIGIFALDYARLLLAALDAQKRSFSPGQESVTREQTDELG